jgi:anti-sigma B factor antagonist
VPQYPSFDLDVHRSGDHIRIAVRGELDVATAPALEQTLQELAREEGVRLVVDLRGLSFMDSTGLRLLVQVDALARRDGISLLVVRGPEPIARLFEMSGLDQLLPLADDPPPGSP